MIKRKTDQEKSREIEGRPREKKEIDQVKFFADPRIARRQASGYEVTI